MFATDVIREEMDEDDDGADDDVAVANYAVVRAQRGGRPPVALRVVTDNVATQQRRRRRTARLLRRVRRRVVGARLSQRVRPSVGVSADVQHRLRSSWRRRAGGSSHLPPSLGPRVHANRNAGRAVSPDRQSRPARTRSDRRAFARPLDVRHFAGRAAHFAADLVGDAGRPGVLGLRQLAAEAGQGDRCGVADRLRPMSDAAAVSAPVARQQSSLVALLQTRALLRRTAPRRRRPTAPATL